MSLSFQTKASQIVGHLAGCVLSHRYIEQIGKQTTQIAVVEAVAVHAAGEGAAGR